MNKLTTATLAVTIALLGGTFAAFSQDAHDTTPKEKQPMAGSKEMPSMQGGDMMGMMSQMSEMMENCNKMMKAMTPDDTAKPQKS